MKRAVRTLILTAVAGALLLGPVAQADTFRVKTTDNNRWNPSFRHINPGDRIVWKNPARHNKVHNIKARGNNWNKFETLSPGEATRKRFRNTGTYKYRCTLHSNVNNGQCNGMCGIIHVAN
jgi:plastocyanin